MESIKDDIRQFYRDLILISNSNSDEFPLSIDEKNKKRRVDFLVQIFLD